VDGRERQYRNKIKQNLEKKERAAVLMGNKLLFYETPSRGKQEYKE